MHITVRAMSAFDWDAVGRIYQEGMDTNLATFQTECPPYEEWDASHLQSCRLVVVDAADTVLGWAALSPVSSRCVYAGVAEVSVYVAADQKGKGIGVLLLNTLAEASEKEGIWTLQSGIMSDNAASIRLHEKCGYRRVGYRERIGRDRNGVWRDTVLMERRSTKIGADTE